MGNFDFEDWEAHDVEELDPDQVYLRVSTAKELAEIHANGVLCGFLSFVPDDRVRYEVVMEDGYATNQSLLWFTIDRGGGELGPYRMTVEVETDEPV